MTVRFIIPHKSQTRRGGVPRFHEIWRGDLKSGGWTTGTKV